MFIRRNPTPLIRPDLDQQRCDCGRDDCDVDPTVYLNSACHTGKGTHVAYNRHTGVATLTCGACDRLICYLQVASELPPTEGELPALNPEESDDGSAGN